MPDAIQTVPNICTVKNCRKLTYKGGDGPEGFVEGLTTWCKAHFFDWFISVGAKIKTHPQTGDPYIWWPLPDEDFDSKSYYQDLVNKRPDNKMGYEISWWRPQDAREPWEGM